MRHQEEEKSAGAAYVEIPADIAVVIIEIEQAAATIVAIMPGPYRISNWHKDEKEQMSRKCGVLACGRGVALMPAALIVTKMAS